MREALGRIGVVAYTSWRGSLVGRRGLGLALVAATYPLLVLAIGASRRTDIDLLAASELLYSALFLPVLLLLLCLVLGVSLFRGEIEDDTIVYPVSRSLPRASLVVGKFTGFVVAALMFLVPAALLGAAFGAYLNVDPGVRLEGLEATLLVTTVLATVAYGAFFLLLGLLTRQALVIGLIYGFFWETFVPLLPGPLQDLTLIHYLRAIGGNLVTTGPLGEIGPPVSLATAVGVPLTFALLVLVVSCLYLGRAELRPEASPA